MSGGVEAYARISNTLLTTQGTFYLVDEPPREVEQVARFQHHLQQRLSDIVLGEITCGARDLGITRPEDRTCLPLENCGRDSESLLEPNTL